MEDDKGCTKGGSSILSQAAPICKAMEPFGAAEGKGGRIGRGGSGERWWGVPWDGGISRVGKLVGWGEGGRGGGPRVGEGVTKVRNVSHLPEGLTKREPLGRVYGSKACWVGHQQQAHRGRGGEVTIEAPGERAGDHMGDKGAHVVDGVMGEELLVG
jgi:hypothetical protein